MADVDLGAGVEMCVPGDADKGAAARAEVVLDAVEVDSASLGTDCVEDGDSVGGQLPIAVLFEPVQPAGGGSA